jgi:tryptophan-rich sensory protein
MKLWLKIVLCVVSITVLGSLGAVFTMSSLKDWYAALAKPPGVPPNAVFGPVWTVLYTLMGISLALFWHRAPTGQAKRIALGFFAIQLILNLVWTPVFFGAHLLGPALGVIGLLWVTILLTILKFRPLDRTAAILLIPYLIWVSYASYLNAGYFYLN